MTRLLDSIPVATIYGEPEPRPTLGRIRVDGRTFREENGALWSWHGSTQFMLFNRFLRGEDVTPQIEWMRRQGVNVARVLGMVAWTDGWAFGPETPGYWDALPRFIERMRDGGLRVEFVVFADAQHVMSDHADQRRHLRRVLDTIGHYDNVACEASNEPWKNGVNPRDIFSADDPRPCLMASGEYTFARVNGEWRYTGLKLDYLTTHLPRDREAWSRKAKDLMEQGDFFGGPAVSDEPMGAAEVTKPGSRSADPAEHFWHHAVCAIFGAGSTFHADSGNRSYIPDPHGAIQQCADAVTLAWSQIGPEWQTGQYTRGGLSSCPLSFDVAFFPEQTSRIYGIILGNRACCVAVKPNHDWRPEAAPGWRIESAHGPQDSLVFLSRT
jgi:hypothetical protein